MSSGTKNLTIVVGNLGQDPEVRCMPNGDAVVNMSIATTETWRNKESGDVVSETEWHRCILFRKKAENAAKFLKKGSKVFISGRLRTRKWFDDKNTVDRYTTEILVNDIQYLDKAPAENSERESDDTPEFPDDIPFPTE